MGASTDTNITFKHRGEEMVIFPKNFNELNLVSGIFCDAKGLLFTGTEYVPTNMIPESARVVVLPKAYRFGVSGITSKATVYFHMDTPNRDVACRDRKKEGPFRTYRNLKGETDTALLIRLYDEATISQTKVAELPAPIVPKVVEPIVSSVAVASPSLLTSQQLDDLLIKSMDVAAQKAAVMVCYTINSDAVTGVLHAKTHYHVMDIINEKAKAGLTSALSKYLPDNRLEVCEDSNWAIKLRLFE